MTQLLLPVGDPPPALLDRIKKIAQAAKAVADAARKANAELYAHGRRFPDAFQISLGFLDTAADDIFLMLRGPLLVGTGDENKERRDNNPKAPAGAEASAQNRGETSA